MSPDRTSARKKARELAKYLRGEHPDYIYMKELFRYLREELAIAVPKSVQKLPLVPLEAQIQSYYQVVWKGQNLQDVVLIKLLLYTGVRVGELVKIALADVDLGACQIRITDGKGHKDRQVPFPPGFKEALGLHMQTMRARQATYLFESSWKRGYSERGVRKILARYSRAAGFAEPISPHQLRHFLLTWLKKQGIDDAMIQPYSGHARRESLEIYSRMGISDAQREYNEVITRFPI